MELFTEYGEAYNDMRNRQGYGPKLGVKPDTHFPSRLERDNENRRCTKEIIDNTDGLPEMTELIVWTHETWERLKALPCCDDRLVIAMSRVQWLIDQFERKLTKLVKFYGVSFQREMPFGSNEWYHQLAVRFCRSMIQEMRVSSPKTFYAKFSSTAFATVVKETQEQVLFEVSDRLTWPCEESVWSQTGAGLLLRFALGIANWKLQILELHALQQQFTRFIDEAVKMLGKEEHVVFESGLREFDRSSFDWNDKVVTVQRFLKATQAGRNSRLLLNCQTPKALLALSAGIASANKSQFWDALFVMAPAGESHNGDFKALASRPLLYSQAKSSINQVWYKIWQIG